MGIFFPRGMGELMHGEVNANGMYRKTLFSPSRHIEQYMMSSMKKHPWSPLPDVPNHRGVMR
jgi:hypothetical protein